MSMELDISADQLGAAGLGSLVNAVVAIAAADGEPDGDEYQAITQHLCSIVGDAETVEALAADALRAVVMESRESLFEQARNTLDTAGREACFTAACAVATKSGGIGTKEGLALQSLAKILEIGYPSQRYTQLLGKGMTMGRS
jgi:tellurite resistance protein